MSPFYIVKLGYAGVYLCFLIFAPKHRLWVLVRTASVRRFRRGGSNVYPQSMFWSQNKKNILTFLLKIFNYFNLRNSLYIAWACFRNGQLLSSGSSIFADVTRGSECTDVSK